MMVLSKKESDTWIIKNRIDEEYLIHDDQYVKMVFKIPVDSGVKNYIAKQLTNTIKGERIFLRIKDYGIFSSAENRELFHGYRKSLGIEQEIHEKPGHIFEPHENLELYCIISMIFYFIWSGVLSTESKEIIVFISHEEFLDIYIKKKKRDIISKVRKTFLDCELSK